MLFYVLPNYDIASKTAFDSVHLHQLQLAIIFILSDISKEMQSIIYDLFARLIHMQKLNSLNIFPYTYNQ